MFNGVKFCGVFRDYQQKILDGAEEYLSDGKINIVAAPGSGKTVLGLELIRRLGKPCLILSPTTTIRDQWGQRFSESFLPQNKKFSEFISYDLRKCSAITSITYQALYSAVERVKCPNEDDYSDIDLLKTVKDAGIETVCLDEAHHLQNEWQRALEKFLKTLGGNIKIISLTATPPYDANAGEWKRYTDVCGDIDEEIFVPELVKQGTLCPHQDYIYFNYPSESEAADLRNYRKEAAAAIEVMLDSGILTEFSRALSEKCADEPFVFSNLKEIAAAVWLFEKSGTPVDKKLAEAVSYRADKKVNVTEYCETAVNFLISSEVADVENAGKLREIFSKRKLTAHGQVSLNLTEKLKRTLISSAGKLESIAEIAKCECENLGKELRLLALTDFIRREKISAIGTNDGFESVSVISVFETVRRSVALPVGALSGALVILPLSCAETLKARGAKFTTKPLNAEGYGEFVFSGGNKEKVGHVGALFESGEINTLVGTKSLLGEGWDSPCINALILASFVGSFMLSNQMRGRAIRVDKRNPLKTANIWHLVTVEPEFIFKDGLLDRKFSRLTESKTELVSCDFETLTRRFNCFVAPAYDTGVIESGIERISVIKPPFNEKGIENINAQTRALSRGREKLKQTWDTAVSGAGSISEDADVPQKNRYPAFNFANVELWALIMSVAAGLTALTIAACVLPIGGERNAWLIAAGVFAAFCLYVIALRFGYRILIHANPKRSIKNLAAAALTTLKQLYLIDGACSLRVNADGLGTYISVGLKNASERDGKLFQNAMAELFSPIENPRYVLIPKNFFGKYNYFCALACPSVFGAKKEYAGQFVRNVKKTLGKIELVYTKTDGGRKFLNACRKFSYINFNGQTVKQLQRFI